MSMKLNPLNLQDYFEIKDPGIIHLKGFRIGIEHIVRSWQEGYTPEQITQEYPGVSLETVYAALAYYLHNKKDIDDYMNRRMIRTEQQMRKDGEKETPPVVRRLRKLKENRSHGNPFSVG